MKRRTLISILSQIWRDEVIGTTVIEVVDVSGDSFIEEDVPLVGLVRLATLEPDGSFSFEVVPTSITNNLFCHSKSDRLQDSPKEARVELPSPIWGYVDTGRHIVSIWWGRTNGGALCQSSRVLWILRNQHLWWIWSADDDSTRQVSIYLSLISVGQWVLQKLQSSWYIQCH